MLKLNSRIKIGTLVKVQGIKNFVEVKEVNDLRTLIKVKGWEGSFQAGHIIKFTNKINKFYYGFRYFSGRNTTTGDRPPFAIAGEPVVFKTQIELDLWLRRERLGEPSGLGGGERVQVTKKQVIKLQRMTREDFEHFLWSMELREV